MHSILYTAFGWAPAFGNAVARRIRRARTLRASARTSSQIFAPISEHRRRYAIEALENRMLLSGSLPASISINLSPQPFGDFGGGIPSGFMANVNAAVSNGAAPGNPDSLIFPTGTVDLYWYGGSVVASMTLVPGPDPGNPNILRSSHTATYPVTLNLSEAGPELSAGPLVGRHILGFSYSGDANFAGYQIDATPAQFAATEAGTYSPRWPVALFDEVIDDNFKMAFLQSPDSAAVNSVLDPAITVQIFDSDGVPATSANINVTLELSGGDGATLSGTTTAHAVNGIATFDDLSIDQPGRYQLIATGISGQQPVFSRTFDVTESQLKFIAAPKAGDAGNKLNPPVVVALQDGKGKTVTSDSTTVVTLLPVGFTDGPITGNIATLVNGIATFDNLILAKPGFYQLQASDSNNDAVATTKKFKVGGLHLEVATQPGEVNVNDGVPFTVAIKNASKKVVTDANSIVQVTLNRLTPGSTGVLEGTTSLSFVGGFATFPVDGGLSIDQPGKYSLTITEVEPELSSGVLIPTNTTSPVVTKAFSVGNYHLAFTKPIGPSDAGKKLDFAIAQQDNKKHTNTKLNGHYALLTLNKVSEGEGGKLSEFTPLGFLAGEQTFNGSFAPSINAPGFYTITATEVDAEGVPVVTTTPVTSKKFKVTGYRVVFISQPTSIQSANLPIPFKIAIQDKNKQIVTNTNDIDVTVSSSLKQGAQSVYKFTDGFIEFTDGDFDDSPRPVVITELGTTQLTINVSDNSSDLGSDNAHISGAVSRPIKVLPRKLAFLQQPAPATDHGPVSFKLGLLTAAGKPQKQLGAGVELVVDGQGGGSILWKTPAFVNGELSSLTGYVDNESVDGSGALPEGKAEFRGVGTYTLTANYSSILDSQHVLPVTSKPFKVYPRRLTFLSQPATAAAGANLSPLRIGLLDVDSNVIPDLPTSNNYFQVVELSYRLASAGDGGPTTVLGTFTQRHRDDDFTGFHIDTPGTYVLVASEIPFQGETAPTPTTSAPFIVT